MNTMLRDIVVDKFLRNEDFIPYLYNRECVEYKLNKTLGENDYGVLSAVIGMKDYIFSVFICGKEYAMKCRSHHPVFDYGEGSVDEFFDNHKWIMEGIDRQLFIELNQKVEKEGVTFEYRTPFPSQTKYFEGLVTVPDEFYKEFIIGSLCSMLYEEGISANFLKVYDFGTKLDCEYTKQKQCIFMEKATDRISNMKSLYTNYGVIIQILHAIGVYQNLCSVSHNDLQLRNIMYKRIIPDDLFNGKRIALYDYFHYSFKGKDIYIPNEGYIVKIIDFDHSDLFGDRPITERKIFNKSYDIYYFIINLSSYFTKRNKTSKMVTELNSLKIGGNYPNKKIVEIDDPDDYYNLYFAEDALSSPMFDHFRNKPLGSIITLGVF